MVATKNKFISRILPIIVVLGLLSACLLIPAGRTAHAEEQALAEALPLIANEPGGVSISGYDSEPSVKYTAGEAATNGVPAGYSGDVVRMGVGDNGVGATFDFTPYNIEIASLKSLAFRVYTGGNDGSANAPNFRIANGSTWIYLNGDITPVSDAEGWTTYTLTVNQTQAQSGHTLDQQYMMHANRFNGAMLKKFFVLFRHGGTSEYNGRSGYYYMDSIVVERTFQERLPLDVCYNGANETAFAHSSIKNQLAERV